MKNLLVMAALCCTAILPLHAYPVRESIFGDDTVMGAKVPSVQSFRFKSGRYEQTTEGQQSLVKVISGINQFKMNVLDVSKSVVVRIHAPQDTKSHELGKICQKLAEEFRGKVQFSSLAAMENKEVLTRIAMMLKLKKMELPLILFFHGGKLILPLVSGLVGEKELKTMVQERFFK